MNPLTADRWSRLWQTVTATAAPAGLHSRLLAMYAEPHRHYHNRRHVAECLNEFDRGTQLATEPIAVEFAIWFHDAVYDPRASDNEERSAGLAHDWLKQAGQGGVLPMFRQQFVLATKTHDPTLHPDAPLLVDVDLSILGKPLERFLELRKAGLRKWFRLRRA